MTKSKSTKRALLSSVLALVLTCTMLLGTTFAWFTDSVKSGANKIVAGNLDVELEYTTDFTTWTSVEGQDALFKTDTLWEPGHAEVVYLRVRNAGTLALKYKFAMNIANETTAKNVAGEDFKLSQYLKYGVVENQTAAFADRATAIAAVTDPTALSGYSKDGNLLPAAEEYVALVVYMPETVGNEANYRGDVIPTIDLGVTLVATQDTVEKDSFGNDYDANAEYPVLAADEATLKQALAAGKDVRLTDDIALTAPITINGDVDVIGDGNSVISKQPVYVATTANVNFKDVNFATPVNSNNNASSVYASGLEGKVVFDSCTFTNPQWESIQITPKDGAEIIVTNCNFIVDGNGVYAKENGTKVERMLHIQNTAATGNYTAVITNNTFIGVDLCRNAVIDVDDIAAFENVTCGGNTFADHDGTPVSSMDDGMIYVNINRLYDPAHVATNTYAQFTQTPAAALQH
ncbi:MAG: right-handed parallel beta-helix repeat-containing protein [Acutalibacteraceae bacterium]